MVDDQMVIVYKKKWLDWGIYLGFCAVTVYCQKQLGGKCKMFYTSTEPLLANLCMFWNTDNVYIKHNSTYDVTRRTERDTVNSMGALLTNVGMLEQAADPGLSLQLLVICGDKKMTHLAHLSILQTFLQSFHISNTAHLSLLLETNEQ